MTRKASLTFSTREECAPLRGLLLVLPVFLTGYDWTRWLTIAAFDVAIVFILFAARRPEVEQPTTSKALRFIVLIIAFALIPVGAVPVSVDHG